MELRARFDEQNNIQWAERMEEAGCTILYGAEDIKVHSKICLITRRERGAAPAHHPGGDGQLQRKDRPAVHRPVPDDRPAGAGGGRRRPVSEPGHSQPGWNIRAAAGLPYQLRDRCIQLIDREIAKGDQGYLFLKLNSITDRKLIDKLAQASQAGVEVVMNVRGSAACAPGSQA